jgi:hypothetical protein
VVTVGTAITDVNGNYDDMLFICTSACLTPNTKETDVLQAITDLFPSNGIAYTLTPNTIAITCRAITVNGK